MPSALHYYVEVYIVEGGRPQILLRVEEVTKRNDKFLRAIMETIQESPEANGTQLDLRRGTILLALDGWMDWLTAMAIPNRDINRSLSVHMQRGTN